MQIVRLTTFTLFTFAAFFLMGALTSTGHAQSIATTVTAYPQAGSGQEVKIYWIVSSSVGEYPSVGNVEVTITHNGQYLASCAGTVEDGQGSCEFDEDEGIGNFTMTVAYSGISPYESSSFTGPVYVYQE